MGYPLLKVTADSRRAPPLAMTDAVEQVAVPFIRLRAREGEPVEPGTGIIELHRRRMLLVTGRAQDVILTRSPKSPQTVWLKQGESHRG